MDADELNESSLRKIDTTKRDNICSVNKNGSKDMYMHRNEREVRPK